MDMQRKTLFRKRGLEGVCILLLFTVFAACILLVLLTGADSYQRLTERDGVAYDRRTAAQYIATKVHQADRQDAVSVCDFAGCSALVLTEKIDGETYLTRIYYYDGYIRELFTSADAEMLPEDGERILKAGSFQPCADESSAGQLYIRILTSDGTWEELYLTLRSGREEPV